MKYADVAGIGIKVIIDIIVLRAIWVTLTKQETVGVTNAKCISGAGA